MKIRMNRKSIEEAYRREASRSGAGFQAHPEDVARAFVGPDIMPEGFQKKSKRLSKAPRRSK